MGKKKNEIYIIGHKNPDTDSICSAIAYAHFKRKFTGEEYSPRRAGQINEETQFVLEHFGIEPPAYMPDVSTQVKDIEIRETKGVSSNISLKKAWQLMRDANVVTLPITTADNKLEGLITIGDIATSYMEVFDSKILGTAKTQYKNIIETIEGELVVGNAHEYFTEGKVLISAANPDMMENYIEHGDLVILGNRYESQFCAIEMGADCMIVCEGAPVSMTIKKLAAERDCAVIQTPHDTYTVARLINQSMPIKYFMRHHEHLIVFQTDDYTDEIKGIMAKKRHRDFPILDKNGNYIGMISRRNLLNMTRKQIILVDHNEKTQAADGIDQAEILEIIDHHRLGSLETIAPVYFRNQPLGCTATIIYKIYCENQVEIEPHIAGLLCSAILSDTLMYRSPTCTEDDRAAAEALSKIAGIESVEQYAQEMFSAGSNLKSKSANEIFYQDFKKFNADDVTFGVGQISSMNTDELESIKEKLIPYLEKAYGEHGLNMLFFMLTNIIDESTEILCHGADAKALVEQSFEVEPESGAEEETSSYILKNVVSRKKQLIPTFMMNIQQ